MLPFFVTTHHHLEGTDEALPSLSGLQPREGLRKPSQVLAGSTNPESAPTSGLSGTAPISLPEEDTPTKKYGIILLN